MKRILSICLAALLLLTSLPLTACKTEPKEEAPTSYVLVKDSLSDHKIVRSDSAIRTSPEREATLVIRDAIVTATGVELERTTDYYNKNNPEAVAAVESAKEILIGHTNRKETTQALEGLQPYEYIIKVIGDKLVICGASDEGTLAAAEYFAANCLTPGTTVEFPLDYEVKGILDMSLSETHGVSYEAMGDVIITAYAKAYIDQRGNLINTEFWDAAETLEAMIDAYEQTGNAQYLEYAEGIAREKFSSNQKRTNWCYNNAYNDDIAWAVIGFTRLYQLTGKKDYLTIAKNNFDTMWARAYSPNVLGGGLWWKDDQKNVKNSCIQCPASIAACLLGKSLGDDSYYEKAKELMDWEFEVLFEPKTGKVYDCKNINGEYNYWASTYNQGTFVGACTLLHEKYGDQKYMDYAAKAVAYGMYSLENVDGVLNGEASGNDLIGFKGILTRWFYRYSKYTGDLDVLAWLQNNADVAYGNRNSKNLIWTAWANKTGEQNYDPWGCSAAVALLFNCEQWW